MPINEVQAGRFNAVLRKLLAMDVGAPSPSLATDIFPTVCLEHDRPEWKFLGNERLCQGGDAIAPTNTPEFFLSNPTGSGAILIVERIHLWTSSPITYSSNIRLVDSGAPGGAIAINSYNRDSRNGWATAGVRTAGRVSYLDTVAPVGNVGGRFPLFGTYPTILETPWVISPGFSIGLEGAGSFVMACMFYWRERVLEESETR